MSSIPPRDRARSPRAPRHGICDAIAYARKIYDGVHRSAIDSLTAYQLMGFAGKSGTSATALGSIRQYRLIEGIGDKTRVTDLALRLFEPASESERVEALSEAAHQPEVFRAIFDRFEGRVPSADEPLRAFLIRELGFSRAGADDCLRSFRETVAELDRQKLLSRLIVPARAVADTGPSEPIEKDTVEAEQLKEQSRGAGELIRLPLTRECSAELRFQGRVTEKAVANLLRHIEPMKDVGAVE